MGADLFSGILLVQLFEEKNTEKRGTMPGFRGMFPVLTIVCSK